MKPTQLAPRLQLPDEQPPESPLFTFLVLAFFSMLTAWLLIAVCMD
jgi:hypothetical protein